MDLVTVVSTKLPWPLPSFTYWYILYKLGWEQAYGVMGLRINKILNVLKGLSTTIVIFSYPKLLLFSVLTFIK
jgi:hypothetical protein